jgi:hypothetical protein
MENGHFYYITDQYFIDFPDPKLMRNKENINGRPHDRPSFYAFKDEKTGLYWMIPFSSQVAKYRKYYDNKMKKYNRCDTILFGTVLGREKAFLVQNMCPITKDYVKNEYYCGRSNIPVRIDKPFEDELLKCASRCLTLQRKGKNLIFPDVLAIEKALLSK